MRWVFYSLLILNLVYLVWSLVDLGASSPEPAPERAPAAEAPRKLKLLDEARASDGQDPGKSQSQQPRGSKRLCPVVGPWDTRSRANQALETLQQAGYKGRVRAVEVERERLHWVYLPPREDRKTALKTLRELQSRGVDSFIVSEGSDRNAISLGYFKSEESASGLRAKMDTAGYDARIRDTVEKVTEYWVYVDSSSVDDDGKALRSFLADKEGLEPDHSKCINAAGGQAGSQ